jgi:hypothetical protein
MKMLMYCLVAVSGTLSKAKDLDLEKVRNNFCVAASNKTICQAMLTGLPQGDPTSTSRAYLGGFQAIWASHVFNPIKKMETFNKGKANIEQAVTEDPSNVEIRFVRLSIQTHCPWFLPYHQQEKEDRSFLIAHRGQVNSPTLKNMIDDILKITE